MLVTYMYHISVCSFPVYTGKLFLEVDTENIVWTNKYIHVEISGDQTIFRLVRCPIYNDTYNIEESYKDNNILLPGGCFLEITLKILECLSWFQL